MSKFDILKRPEFDCLEVGYQYFYGLDAAPKESKCSTINSYRQDEVDSWLDQLYEVLGKAEVVYGRLFKENQWWMDKGGMVDQTHQALLINVKEIEKKDCAHFANLTDYGWECKYCGKHLKPIWEVIE